MSYDAPQPRRNRPPWEEPTRQGGNDGQQQPAPWDSRPFGAPAVPCRQYNDYPPAPGDARPPEARAASHRRSDERGPHDDRLAYDDHHAYDHHAYDSRGRYDERGPMVRDPWQSLPAAPRRAFAPQMTTAATFWYVLGCIPMGAMYLAKVPCKKAMEEAGLGTMTSAERFWYVLGCIPFGAAYLAKLPVAKALTEVASPPA
jgi:hypothetical protein